MKKSRITAALVGLVVAVATAGTIAMAQQQGGPGYGPGYSRGGGGYGPGMMGGYGPGPGMMGGYGGGYGQGWGRGGYGLDGPLAALNLTEEQREKVAKIQEENRSKNWNTMGQMQSEMFKLRQMYFSEKLDANALSEQQRKVDELRRQMLKSRVEARNEMAAVLTPDQRQQLRSFGPWWQDRGE
ncbi:MAG: Spy/CpxP family protein refolding chaperone [Burkholderiales bacterium]